MFVTLDCKKIIDVIWKSSRFYHIPQDLSSDKIEWGHDNELLYIDIDAEAS